MKSKSHAEFRRGLEESVFIIETEIQRLGYFPLAWQSLATQLNKILCDKTRRGALLPRVVLDPTLHPMKNMIKPHANIWAMGYSITMGGGRMGLRCFDETQARISLEQWLNQIMFVAKRIDFTVFDVVTLSRNKEAGHFDKHEHEKYEVLKVAHNFVVGGEKLSPLTFLSLSNSTP